MTQAETQLKAADGAVAARLPETYQWLLVPVQATPQAPLSWEAVRLTGQDALAPRASKKLRSEELLIAALGATRLRMEMDKVPLWRGNHVSVSQLAQDFASYLYLPRLRQPMVLAEAARVGISLLTWEQDGFAYAESYDEVGQRYRGLRCNTGVMLTPDDKGLLVKPEAARAQLDQQVPPPPGPGPQPDPGPGPGPGPVPEPGPNKVRPKRYFGTVQLDSERVGRDAGQIASEVIAHLTGLVGAKVSVTLEITAEIPEGAPEHVVRIVTENARTLKFGPQGFEAE